MDKATILMGGLGLRAQSPVATGGDPWTMAGNLGGLGLLAYVLWTSKQQDRADRAADKEIERADRKEEKALDRADRKEERIEIYKERDEERKEALARHKELMDAIKGGK